MKILILSDDFPPQSFGGAGMVAFNLASAFQREGQQVFVITTTRDKSQAGEITYQGLKIFRICSNYHERWRGYLSLYNPQTVGKVRKLIKEIKPDIIHAHNIHYYLSYYCLKIAKRYVRAVFLTAHDVMLFSYEKLTHFINPNDLSVSRDFNYKVTCWDLIKQAQKRYNPFRNIIIRHYLKYVDKIFAVSQTLKLALNDNKIKNVEVIYNGIDVTNWQVSDEEVRRFGQRYNIQNKKVIFFGGRLNKLKGGEKIIRAMKEIVSRIPGAILLVVGEKESYAQEMLEVARQLGIEDNIVLTGWLKGNELKSAYYCSDIITVPSICFDTFSLNNIEAMACQKPVVGTCFGGTPEIVVDGMTGYIVNPFGIKMMAEKIIDLLSDDAKAKKFGKAGYRRVIERFSLAKQVEETLKWYKKHSQ